MLRVVRLNIEPAEYAGEVSLLWQSPWQGQVLVQNGDYMIEICKDKELEKIHAVMLPIITGQ